MEIRIGVLGPTTLAVDGAALPLTAGRLRALLSLLALRRGRTVPSALMTEVLWGTTPPPSAVNTLQGYVSTLRRLLEPHREARRPAAVLVTRPDGYLLELDPGCVDLTAFERGVTEAVRALGEVVAPAALLGTAPGAPPTVLRDEHQRLVSALELWRGDPLPDLGDHLVAEGERRRLAAVRLDGRLALAAAAVALGRCSTAVPELESLAEEHPWDERVWGTWAVALARSGRQADALARLRRLRAAMAEELGLDPGPETRALETAIAAQRYGGPAPAEPTPPSRRTARSCIADRWPLVGREREAAVLTSALDAVAAGGSELLHLAGEHGTGKSRLVRELRSAAHARGVAFAAVDPADLTLEWLAATEPTVLCVEDVQHAGPRALDRLGRLAEELATSLTPPPLALVVTQRAPARPPAALARLVQRLGRAHATQLHLGPLDLTASAALVEAVTGAAVPAGPLQRIHARAGGNPFLLVELARARSAGTFGLPAAVQAVVAGHLRGLDRDVLTWLRGAALLGPGFDAARLAGAGSLPVELLHRTLEPAVAAGVLVELDDDQYLFAHAVVVEVLEAELSPRQRADWLSRLAPRALATSA